MNRILTVMLTAAAILTTAASLHALHVRVNMSDGSSFSGECSIIGNRPIIITPLNSRQQRKIMLKDIISISQVIEKQSMIRPWMYKEAGKTEKIYSERQYPFIEFITDILLVNGENIRGYLISTPLKIPSAPSGKLFLVRQIKGQTGQDFDSLPHPVNLSFDNPAAKTGNITVHCRDIGTPIAATALDNERGNVCHGIIKDSSITFTRLLPGTYDLFILSDTLAIAGLSNPGPGIIPTDAAGQLETLFLKADDFFTDRWIVAVKGSEKLARTLVYKRRAEYYAAKTHTPGGYIWHLDVWTWHAAGDEWKLDRRHIMLRHKQQKNERVRPLHLCDKLAAINTDSEITIDQDCIRHAGKPVRNLD